MGICPSRYRSLARLRSGPARSAAGRHGCGQPCVRLVYRLDRPAVQPPPVVHHTVQQTVVQLHQVNHQHILNRVLPPGTACRAAMLVLARPPARRAEAGNALDPSRPSWTAQRMLRILRMQSAQRILQPLFQDLLHTVLREERERWYTRPRQSFSLLFGLLGWRYAQHPIDLRYAPRYGKVADDLQSLPVARRALPPPEAAGHGSDSRTAAPRAEAAPEPERELRLGGAAFRALVRDVAGALGRQNRLEQLRRGGG